MQALAELYPLLQSCPTWELSSVLIDTLAPTRPSTATITPMALLEGGMLLQKTRHAPAADKSATRGVPKPSPREDKSTIPNTYKRERENYASSMSDAGIGERRDTLS